MTQPTEAQVREEEILQGEREDNINGWYEEGGMYDGLDTEISWT